MSRKARGARGRLASPAQMERLHAVLGHRLTKPLPFEEYRHWMRSQTHTARQLEKELEAWAHQAERAGVAADQPYAPDVDAQARRLRLYNEARLIIGTSPRGQEM